MAIRLSLVVGVACGLMAWLSPWGFGQQHERPVWYASLSEAQREAARSGRLVLLHFWSEQCGPCQHLERHVLNEPLCLQALATHYVPVRINVNQHPKLAQQFQVDRIPTDVVITADGRPVHRSVSPSDLNRYVAMLRQVAAHAGLGRQPEPTPPYHQGPSDALAASGQSHSSGIGTVANIPQQPTATSQSGPVLVHNPYVVTAVNTPRYVAPPSESAGQRSTGTAFTQMDQPSMGRGPADLARPQPPTRPGTAPAGTQPPIANTAVAKNGLNTEPARAELPLSRYSAEQSLPNVPATPSPPTANTVEGSALARGTPVPVSENRYGMLPHRTISAPQPPSPAAPSNQATDAVTIHQPVQYTIEAPLHTEWKARTNPPTAPPPISQTEPMGTPPTPWLSVGPLGLDGYCPVSLVEKNTWTKGNPSWVASHEGRLYLFAGPEQLRAFQQAPQRYAPVLAGFDVVRFHEEKQLVAGKREYGVAYGNRIYLFSDERSLQQFWQNPSRYAETRPLMALRPDTNLTR